MIEWLANWLSQAGGVVASWFVSKDAPDFDFFGGLMAVLVLAALVSVIVFWQTLIEYWRSRWKSGE